MSVVVVSTRLAWTFILSWLARALPAGIPGGNRKAPWPEVALIGWMGMRGAVSLAAALALPVRTDAGAPFDERSVILFVVFAVILFTLVVQGLTVTPVVRALGVRPDDAPVDEENRARLKAAEAALARLESLAGEEWTLDDSVDRARAIMAYRRARFASRFREDDDGRYEDRTGAWVRLQIELIEVQRAGIEQLRRDGEISDDVMRVDLDLDLEETRLLS